MNVLLVDPSLFTAPYDAALTEGLVEAGVTPVWAVRPTRMGDRQELREPYVDAFFYRGVDANESLPIPLRSVAKGFSHAVGLTRLVMRVRKHRPQVVHFQWIVLPLLDLIAIALIRRVCPVALTVHDTMPFNGQRMSVLQRLGFDLPIRVVDGIVVHTLAGREQLISRGVAATKIAVIPHGPLKLHAQPKSKTVRKVAGQQVFVLFGEIKPYKGVDVLLEAIALLPDAHRSRAKFIVAGRPRMDMTPLERQVVRLKLQGLVEFRSRRLSDQEMADLFEEANCFVFPYRQIDASGVYFLVKRLGRWLIASRVGIFAEDLQDGRQGALVRPEDPAALAAAIADAIANTPKPQVLPEGQTWPAIGRQTLALYQQLAMSHASHAVEDESNVGC